MPATSNVSLPADVGLDWSPLDAVTTDDVHALCARVWAHDGHHETPTVEALRISERYGDLARDGVVGTDADGVPRAFVRVVYRESAGDLLKATVRGAVDPGWRGRGIGRALVAWGLARGDEVVEHLRTLHGDLPVSVGTGTEDHVEPEVRLMRAMGLRPTRWFSGMRWNLADATTDVPPVPDGLRLVTWEEPGVAERARLAHNEAFHDHWGSAEFSAEDWAEELDGPEFRPALSVAVLDGPAEDAPVVAYSLNSEYEQDWERQGHSELYVDALGTLRSQRGRGLASLLLHWSAARAAERGHPALALDVDTDNPNGALRLYEGLGFVKVSGETRWERA